MNVRCLAAAVAVVLAAAVLVAAGESPAANPAAAPSWPEFHGAGRTNISPDHGLLKQWPEGGPPLVWKYSECGEGYSGVSIADGMIFTAGYLGGQETVLALDMDGKLLWKAPNGEAWSGPSPGSRTTPTFSEGALYQMSAAGRLAAFQAKTGKPVWTVDLVAEFGAKFGVWAAAENVVVDGDKVLCMPGGPKGRVVALDKRSGKKIWANTEIEHTAAYCSPLVVTYRGVRQLVTMTQKSVLGVEVETGRLVWQAPFLPKSPQNALTPVFYDGQVFVACGHWSGGTVLKVDPEAKTASTVWFRKELDNCHGGAMLIDGRLYGAACRQGGKDFYCVDFATGKTIKTDATIGKSGITVADGMMYCLNHRGTVSLLEIGPDGFRIVSQFNLKRQPDNYYLAHPVVCGGRLYLRGGPDLYVYDVRAKQG